MRISWCALSEDEAFNRPGSDRRGTRHHKDPFLGGITSTTHSFESRNDIVFCRQLGRRARFPKCRRTGVVHRCRLSTHPGTGAMGTSPYNRRLATRFSAAIDGVRDHIRGSRPPISGIFMKMRAALLFPCGSEAESRSRRSRRCSSASLSSPRASEPRNRPPQHRGDRSPRRPGRIQRSCVSVARRSRCLGRSENPDSEVARDLESGGSAASELDGDH